jgi:hypothetical protein
VIGRKSLDSPLDYRELWLQLAARVEELSAKAATDAMNDDDEVSIRKKQGAYRFGYTILSEMDRMVEEARAQFGPLRQSRAGLA